jgi:hypothetical protein
LVRDLKITCSCGFSKIVRRISLLDVPVIIAEIAAEHNRFGCELKIQLADEMPLVSAA